MENIDFVVLWVDGSDRNWLYEKEKYAGNLSNYGTGANRFRDWDNLQYFFRGVEQFAPWVNNIFFVTWGHIPKWLNTDHPKLRIINHSDFIPSKYLPTFNSDTIETNLHRIADLSEQFVLFNDDTFLIDKVEPSDFFIEGKPCDSFVENLIAPIGHAGISHTKVVITDIINDHFNKRTVHINNINKVFNRKYGLQNLFTMYFLPFPYFTGFRNPHLPQSHLKSTFETVWSIEFKTLDISCQNRFRGSNDVSHWLMRYWNLCSGNFVPRNISVGKYFEVSSSNKMIIDYICNRSGKMICINDMSTDYDFDKAKTEINNALNIVMNKQSSFEINS